MAKVAGLLVLALACNFVKSAEVVCYFTDWSIYRDGIGNFQVSDIDSSLCTIINYAFVGLWGETGELRVLDSYSDDDLGNLAAVVALKESNSNLKVLISMGGWNEGSTNYSKVAANETLRSNFVASVLSYIEANNLDGLDLNWIYPTKLNGSDDDADNLITLLSEVNDGFESKDYLLTITVAGAGTSVDDSYNVSTLIDLVDYINLMLYDFRAADWVNYTAHHSPLYPCSQDVTDEEKQLSVEGGIKQWLEKGVNASQLILGIPFYARTFDLEDPDEHGLYAPTDGSGPAGPLTLTEGVLSYQETCFYFNNFTHVWNEEQQAPYAYSNSTWFSYDNPESVKLKTEYAVTQGLAGVMVWSLDYDDFDNSCGNGSYPLLNAVADGLGS